jgi:hypothetical protein
MSNETMLPIAPALRMNRVAREMPALWNMRARSDLGEARNA